MADDFEGGKRRPCACGPVCHGHPRPLLEEKERRAQELRAEGLTYEVIAERLGVHRNTAYLAAKRGGLVVEVLCASCGRRTWRRSPGPEALARPVVCDACKPKWKKRMNFKGRS